MTETTTPAQRVERFLEAWDRKRDSSDVIYALGMFADEDETRDLCASDLRALIATPELSLAEQRIVSAFERGPDKPWEADESPWDDDSALCGDQVTLKKGGTFSCKRLPHSLDERHSDGSRTWMSPPAPSTGDAPTPLCFICGDPEDDRHRLKAHTFRNRPFAPPAPVEGGDSAPTRRCFRCKGDVIDNACDCAYWPRPVSTGDTEPDVPDSARLFCGKTQPHSGHDWTKQTGSVDFDTYWCGGRAEAVQ